MTNLWRGRPSQAVDPLIGPLCYLCKTKPVRHQHYPCATCRKLWVHTKEEIERLRFEGDRIDVDFSDAPIADPERIAAVSAIVCKLTMPRAQA